jgi:Sulfotransferase family
MCDTGPAMTESAPTGSGQEAPEAAPKVIYIVGAGRSGSTVLGVTLGNCDGVFFAGELDAWLPRSGEPQLDGGERVRFWNEVREQVAGADLYGHDAQRSLERSLALFRPHRWLARRRLRAAYARIAEELYRAISHATGGAAIVDSSHYPLRARELQAIDGIELHLLFLVRDPQGVVASFTNRKVAQYNKSTLTTNVYLWLTNLLSLLVYLKHPRDRRVFVRYEDFAADPQRTVQRVLKTAGVTASQLDTHALRTGIPFQGNRVIKSEVIELEPATTPESPSRVTAVLQLPMTLAMRRLNGGPGGPGR